MNVQEYECNQAKPMQGKTQAHASFIFCTKADQKIIKLFELNLTGHD